MKNMNYNELNFDDSLLNLMHEHGLLIIKNAPPLEKNEYTALISKLGKLLIGAKHTIDDDRCVQLLSNDELFGVDEVVWHNDWSYGRGNYFGTALLNVENAQLSNTSFLDMSKLPKNLIEQYKNVNGLYHPPVDLKHCFSEREWKILERVKQNRPMIFNHPITGEELLYCSPGTQQNIEIDLSDIIKYANNNSYVHTWEKGDLLIWDNLKMMHKREQFNGTRKLWRIQFQNY